MQNGYHIISDVESKVCRQAVRVPVPSDDAHTPFPRTQTPFEHSDVLAGRVVQRSHIGDMPARLHLTVHSPHEPLLRFQLLHSPVQVVSDEEMLAVDSRDARDADEILCVVFESQMLVGDCVCETERTRWQRCT